MRPAVTGPRFGVPAGSKPTDCVLESSDGTRWDVHMSKLAACSSLFADMADLAGEQDAPAGQPVKLVDKAEYIDVLLHSAYGTLSPDMLAKQTTRFLVDSFNVAHKYSAPGLAQWLSWIIRTRFIADDDTLYVLESADQSDDAAMVDYVINSALPRYLATARSERPDLSRSTVLRLFGLAETHVHNTAVQTATTQITAFLKSRTAQASLKPAHTAARVRMADVGAMLRNLVAADLDAAHSYANVAVMELPNFACCSRCKDVIVRELGIMAGVMHALRLLPALKAS